MISTKPNPLITIFRETANFNVDGMTIPYAEFVPRLYNLCIQLGFRKDLIMPSRAFCSDENQGIPIILLTKHFGIFPFNHGRVGGMIAVDRHAPHASHGEDSVIVQASHVGYDPNSGVYGPLEDPECLTKASRSPAENSPMSSHPTWNSINLPGTEFSCPDPIPVSAL